MFEDKELIMGCIMFLVGFIAPLIYIGWIFNHVEKDKDN